MISEEYYDGTGTGDSHITHGYTYTYDTAGNILSVKDEDGTILKTYTYSTGDWKDLLTAVTVGTTTHTLQYDQSGNPTTYGNGQRLYTNLTWEHGRQLVSLTTNGSTYNYDYDHEGIRSRKVVNGTTHTYITQGGKIVRETIQGTTQSVVLDFIYDNAGRPFALQYSCDGGEIFTTYYYVTNYQGDVVALLDSNCNVVARYSYNAWGELISVTNDQGAPITDSANIAHLNPLRYRGYYYDAETGFYYLQSRYYDPVNCRFINADSIASTGQGLLGYNMFAYCRNNPVSRKDTLGKTDVEADENIQHLYELLSDNTTITETGFVIDIESDAEDWHETFSAIGIKESYTLMANYLCDEYKALYSKEFLFSNECVAYEIEYHVDAYMCMQDKKGYSRNITTLIYTKKELLKRCGLINISTNDTANFKQKKMFGYKRGIRDSYKNTTSDPYNRFSSFIKGLFGKE